MSEPENHDRPTPPPIFLTLPSDAGAGRSSGIEASGEQRALPETPTTGQHVTHRIPGHRNGALQPYEPNMRAAGWLRLSRRAEPGRPGWWLYEWRFDPSHAGRQKARRRNGIGLAVCLVAALAFAGSLLPDRGDGGALPSDAPVEARVEQPPPPDGPTRDPSRYYSVTCPDSVSTALAECTGDEQHYSTGPDGDGDNNGLNDCEETPVTDRVDRDCDGVDDADLGTADGF